MESFYVTLFSFENSPAEIKTTFPINHDFVGSWEVGLAEIAFTKSLVNIPRDLPIELVYYSIEKGSVPIRTDDAVVPYGHYTLPHLADTINNVIKLLMDEAKEQLPNTWIYHKDGANHYDTGKPSALFRPEKNYIQLFNGVAYYGDLIFIRPNPLLSTILGYDYLGMNIDMDDHFTKYLEIHYPQRDRKWNQLSDFTFEKINPYYLHDPLRKVYRRGTFNYETRNLFLLSDICTPRIVGERLRPLLRIVKIPSIPNYGSQVMNNYLHPQYIPVSKTKLENIELKIMESINPFKIEGPERIADFLYGQTIVTLHFRKRSDAVPVPSINPVTDNDFTEEVTAVKKAKIEVVRDTDSFTFAFDENTPAYKIVNKEGKHIPAIFDRMTQRLVPAVWSNIDEKWTFLYKVPSIYDSENATWVPAIFDATSNQWIPKKGSQLEVEDTLTPVEKIHGVPKIDVIKVPSKEL